MKLQIKYIFLLVLLSSVVLFPALTGCVEDSIGAIDAKTNQTGDKDEHAGHDHAAEDVKVEDEHAGHDNAAEETSHDEEEGIRILPQAFSDAGIVVERLKPRLLSATLELSGTVLPHPKGEGFVGSLMEGRIKEIFVDIGDYVKEGAALCVIESPAVGEAEAAYITAVAELEFVKGDLERHKILVSEGIESKKGLLELEASLLSCSSKVSAAEITLQAYGFNDEDIKMLDSDQFTGGRVTLRSPTSGTVISLDVRSGMRVTPESDLIHIVNMEKLRVHVDIPEQRISEVAKGAEITIVSQNGHISELKGVIDRLGGSINQDTRTLTAFASVDNSNSMLRPGAFVSVRLSVGDEDNNVLAVPFDAVFKDKIGDNLMFVESEPGLFVFREVEVGLSIGGWTPIISGISIGERIVTKGAFAIKSEAEKSLFSHGCAH